MGILGPLSRRVGSTGRVVGIDREQPLLGAAHVYVREEGLPNVEILERDALNTESDGERSPCSARPVSKV